MDSWKRVTFRIRGWLIDGLNSLMNLLVDKSPEPNPDAVERAKFAPTHTFVVRLEWDADDQTYYAYIPELDVMTNADTLPEALYMAGDAGKLVLENIAYDLHTIEYEYDLLSRLLSADYHPGQNIAATPFHQYDYTFDRAGNRRQQIVTVSGTPTTTDFDYNEANQLIDDGTNTYDYDANGNLWKVNTLETYGWDRANRLLSFGGIDYKYDGAGNRIQQSNGFGVTKYLLDLQPGLSVVLAETTGANTTRNVHAPRGIHAHKDASGAWEWMVQDGLGSVRGVVDNTVGVLESRNYDPYGTGFGSTGSSQTIYGFTGEPTDANGLLYLRARYYNSAAGVFTALDPFEGISDRVMSLNGYSWVEGNPVMSTDPSGATPDRGEMERSDKFRYSCKCGWLDAAHIDYGVPAGMETIVSQPINWSLFSEPIQQLKTRAIYPWFISAIGVNFGSINAVISENDSNYINVEKRKGIAVGIWLETHEMLERLQGEGIVGLVSSTSFSIEDLVSDLVGYAAYSAGQNWQNKVSSEILSSIGLGSADYSATWQNSWVQQQCGVLDKQQSLDMYDRFVQAGGFPKNDKWQPLPLPSGVTNPYCEGTDVVAAFKNTAMHSILSTALYSHSGAWRWEYYQPTSPYRLKASYVDQSLRNSSWDLVERHLYVVIPPPSGC